MRKLLMLVAMALAAVAFAGVSAASAVADVPFEVRDSSTGEPCPELSTYQSGFAPYHKVGVSGGCRVDGFDGSFRLHQAGGTIGTYSATFDLVAGPDGEAYAVDVNFYDYGFGPPRSACMDPLWGGIPWPVQIRALGGGEFEVDVTIKLSANGGSQCGWQTITMAVDHFGVDGWTEFVQEGSSLNIDNGYWSSVNAVGLVEVGE